MLLKEIIERFSKLNVCEQRNISDEYDELVFYSKEMDEWNKIFADILGSPIKPAGAEPTKEDLLLVKDFGGINDNQTLFKKEFDDVTVIAMFWPWRDNIHTTLKIVLSKEAV